jgi:hypothetical protein
MPIRSNAGSMNKTVLPPVQSELSPERGIMEALLRQAERDLANATTDIVEEVVAWFERRPRFDGDGQDWMYSFTSVCEELKLSPSYLCEKLKEKYAHRWHLKGPRVVKRWEVHSFVSKGHCYRCRNIYLRQGVAA